MKLYRRKWITISAKQFIPENFDPSGATFTIQGPDGTVYQFPIYCDDTKFLKTIKLQTETEEATANLLDWIIVGRLGGMYACSPDKFQASYEPAE